MGLLLLLKDVALFAIPLAGVIGVGLLIESIVYRSPAESHI